MKPFSLVGVDGNVFNVMAYTQKAMKAAGYTKEERDQYFKLCTEELGSYDEILVTSMEWIDKCNEVLGLDDEEEDENE